MKNKKILGALAALCMGVILCVSSVFAVNYWYTIDNSTANNNTITMGKVVDLKVANTAGQATGLYPGATIIFEDITVDAPDWDTAAYTPDDGTGSATNITLPTFDLVLESFTETTVTDDESNDYNFSEYITITATTANTGVVAKADVACVAENVLVDNIQAGADQFTVTITVTIKDNMPMIFELANFNFKVKIVVDAAFGAHTNI